MKTCLPLCLSLLTAVLLPCGGLDVSDICTHCSCQYLASAHLTETICTADHPVLEVNCTTKPNVRQNPNQFLNAPTTSNASVVVWLSYKHAGLTSLHPFTQFSSYNVTLLSLDHNKLVYIPPRGLTALKNLHTVTASHNDINSVAPDAFKGLKHLRYVDLSFNSLHLLDFKLVLDAVNLISLNLRNNLVKTVVAPELPINTLESLDLSVNKIPDFPLLFFSSFPKLIYLNISYNELGTLPADSFHDLSKLKVLDASGIQVRTLDRKVVENLKSLNRLYLSENFLSEATFVEVLPALTTLDLRHNNLTTLGDKLLSSSLQRLVISHNRLTDLSHVFKVFNQLKSLDAGWNPSTQFPEHVRAGLQELILDGTQLRSWPAQRPGEGGIDHLSLSHIPGITALGPFAFSGILKNKNESGKCVFLKISNTSLNTIDEDAFTDIDICKLDLSYNQLRWVPESLLRWDTLVAVDLQHNPWHCDCALQWMLSTVVPSAYRTDQQLLAELRCASPPELAGERLVHWYNHKERVLCGPTKHDAMLTPKARTVDEGPLPQLVVTVSSSPLMIAVLLFLSIVAAMLVILAFALQRRAIRNRKMRRNRRF
uniref:LRRCT domain-containing protein n=1 Tax=Cuerna arida TaxID=1464854 RepID=A0A1B6GM32_9HEMI